MSLHIIVPAHNEETHIHNCLHALTTLYPTTPITIATDGNKDATTKIARQHQLTNLNLFVQEYPYRIGKGEAIKLALLPKTFNAYIDADLAVQPTAIKQMLNIAQKTNGLVIAKRKPLNRSIKRTITSKLYNNTVKAIFNTGVSDHQCGCKVLSPEATDIALTINSHDFFFDTELIVRCKKAKISIVEYEVSWVENKKKSTVHVFGDGFKMFKQLVKLRFSKP